MLTFIRHSAAVEFWHYRDIKAGSSLYYPHRRFIGAIHCRERITVAQRRRLPKWIQERFVPGKMRD